MVTDLKLLLFTFDNSLLSACNLPLQDVAQACSSITISNPLSTPDA